MSSVVAPILVATERAKQARTMVDRAGKTLADERAQLATMRAASPAPLVSDVRAMERIVALSQVDLMYWNQRALDFEEVARGGR